MSKSHQKGGNTRDFKYSIRWGCLMTIGIVTLVVLTYSLLARHSVEEQLREIEIACAIPDSENAALIYNEVLAKYGDIQSPPDFLDDNASEATISHSWTSLAHPKLAEWIEGHEHMVPRLVEAAKMGRCYFEINRQEGIMDRLMARVMWEDFLTRAANRDLAEGRSDKAIEKYMVMIQFGRHLGQQPTFMENLAGIELEEYGMKALIRFLPIADHRRVSTGPKERLGGSIRSDVEDGEPAFQGTALCVGPPKGVRNWLDPQAEH
jgi:hypothetical protein